MSEDKLDFSDEYCDYNDDFESIEPANDYKAAIDILRACTGLTLAETLARLNSPATEPIVGFDHSAGSEESARVEIVECPRCKYRIVVDIR